MIASAGPVHRRDVPDGGEQRTPREARAARVLFVPYSVPGHVRPVLPVVAALTGRGARVWVLAGEPFAAQLRATGATVVPLSAVPDVFVPERLLGRPGLRFLTGRLRRPLVNRRAAAELSRVLDEIRPDLVVLDPMLGWADRLTRRRTTPSALLSTTFAATAEALAEAARAAENRADRSRADRSRADRSRADDNRADRGRAGENRADRSRADRGRFGEGRASSSAGSFPVPGGRRTWHGAARSWVRGGWRRWQPATRRLARGRRLVLAHATPWLQAGATDGVPRIVPVGPLLAPDRPGPHPVSGLLTAGRRVLFVSPGTVYARGYAFFRDIADAFAGSDWTVVLATGHLDPAALGPLPPGVVAYRTVPQRLVLAHAAAFVTHGGMNSTLEAVSAGVPPVFAPRSPEQWLIARRCVDRGVGMILPEPALLRRTVEDLIADPAARSRLASFRAGLTAGGGADRAAALLLTEINRARTLADIAP